MVIEPLEPIADRYFGAFKVDEWPEDLDGFFAEVLKERWGPKRT